MLSCEQRVAECVAALRWTDSEAFVAKERAHCCATSKQAKTMRASMLIQGRISSQEAARSEHAL
jgi:hypothetical protein